jgi:glycosyltransferase involved in cell wall biosynthesis
MKKPKITLITCSYFRPDLLRRAIQSAQRQTLEDFEHLIISDHDPFTELVCNDFKDDSRIKFIENKDPYVYNLGAVSFNLGIKLAKGEMICYLLDDDILYPNHLESHYAMGTSQPNILNYDSVLLGEPDNTVKNICSKTFDDLYNMRRQNNPWSDVGSISHIRSIGSTWPLQSELDSMSGGWEDNVFMSNIGIPSGGATNLEKTWMKMCWGGANRKDSKGLDKEYYDLLHSKLDKSGKLIDSNPYVYESLKDKLYE